MQSGGYTANPIEGSTILAMGQILDGMTPDSPPTKEPGKQLMPVAWYRTYTACRPASPGRVFTTTHGASEDLLNDGFRRMSVNAILWAAGLEAAIQPTSDIALRRSVPAVDLQLRRIRQGREAGRPGGLGFADPAESPEVALSFSRRAGDQEIEVL